ncbi:hypothetical protein LUZ63_017347 [Rhynchospora breviuscula]|uniref:Uncharacterized protein n=1 Tax=Rhynchospora breviuscula TaxID=2022672 RepID=A0A9Q0C2B3_9POAL|nr:hypothetical protein LUZ63_017347 [Rhynchospora breviuscula]
MAMAIIPFFFLLTFLILSLFLSNSQTIAESLSSEPSAYDMLEKYNFPRGILPEGVTDYLLQSDGYFEVYFKSDCEFKVAKKYLARYDQKISGYIDTGTLKNLNGISVKVLFIWIGVSEVDRASETEINFYLGPILASFGVSSFEDSPKCRCSLDRSNTTVVI